MPLCRSKVLRNLQPHRGWIVTTVLIKLPKQVFRCAERIARISVLGNEELAVAFTASSHGGHLPVVLQDDEVAVCHGSVIRHVKKAPAFSVKSGGAVVLETQRV